ncbi:MAG: substrate-binding domain-containing protein, partial [Cellulomonas sp.]
AVHLLPVMDVTKDSVATAFDRLDEQAVDGIIILIEAHLLDEADVQLPEGLPVVVVDSSAHYDYPIVDTDQEGGVRRAVEHLLAMGHETVWHVAGPTTSSAAQERTEAWGQVLTRAGASVPPVHRGDWTAGSGYRIGALLAEVPRDELTAVFCANDQMAIGLMRAFHERGVRIPQDVSVVGFDDEAGAAYFVPPLTTVRQDFPALGRSAIRALVAALAGDPPPRTLLPATLVPRASTAPPPAR